MRLQKNLNKAEESKIGLKLSGATPRELDNCVELGTELERIGSRDRAIT